MSTAGPCLETERVNFSHRWKEQITVACQALLQERMHEHIVEPSFSRSATVGSCKRANLNVTLTKSLDTAMARAREEEGDFLQAVLRERQAEVYFRRNLEEGFF